MRRCGWRDAGAEPDMWRTRAVHEWAEAGTPHIRLRPGGRIRPVWRFTWEGSCGVRRMCLADCKVFRLEGF